MATAGQEIVTLNCTIKNNKSRKISFELKTKITLHEIALGNDIQT